MPEIIILPLPHFIIGHFTLILEIIMIIIIIVNVKFSMLRLSQREKTNSVLTSSKNYFVTFS